jgi:cation:H+ antiporter
MVLVSALFALICWRRKQISRAVGGLLFGGFIIWLAMLYWLSPLLTG